MAVSAAQTLGFVQADRKTRLPATGRGATQRPASFEDFTIDGVRLYEILFQNFDPDNVTAFDSVWPELGAQSAEELLGERESGTGDGRVPIYICPECGDLGCGALTLAIERGEEVVVWKDLGWQNDYEPGWEVGDYTQLSGLTFTFERKGYERTLRDMKDRYAAMEPVIPPEVERQPSLLQKIARRISGR